MPVPTARTSHLGAHGAKADGNASTILRWAADALVQIPADISALTANHTASIRKVIGDASLVALGEPVHGYAEPLEFRNHLFEHLVRTSGFSAIAIESGIVESRVAHKYVSGARGRLDQVVRDGFSWNFDELPQNWSLIKWLRKYNLGKRVDKVNFYGFDLPGSPGQRARRGLSTALAETLRYLQRVDRPLARNFRERLSGLWGRIRFELHRSRDIGGYEELSQSERDSITATIADLIAILERYEGRYSSATGPEDYEWGLMAARGARQADGWLRQIPIGWRPTEMPVPLPSKEFEFLAAANDVRDRAQFENLEWIIEREAPRGRLFLFAHRYHLSGVALQAPWSAKASKARQEVLGTYLKRRLGNRMVTIGMLVGDPPGSNGAGLGYSTDGSAPLEQILKQLSVEAFLLDLRTAPSGVSSYLEREHLIGAGLDRATLAIGSAFDVLLYVHQLRATTESQSCDA